MRLLMVSVMATRRPGVRASRRRDGMQPTPAAAWRQAPVAQELHRDDAEPEGGPRHPVQTSRTGAATPGAGGLGVDFLGSRHPMVMRTIILFPTDAERLARDVAEFQGLTSHQRVQALLDLSRLCDALRRASPTAALQLQLLEEQAREEKERWREIMERHA